MNVADYTPGHCYARAQLLVAELELIRAEMGRAKDERTLPAIANGSPREAYFGALAAWHKATRLSDEVGIRVGRPAPSAPAIHQIRPGHVHQLIDATLLQVEDIRQLLGITAKLPEFPVDPSKLPGDVFTALTQANRLLSAVLERPFTPSDVYRVVALAAAYASRITNQHVELEPYERYKQPGDCYAKLESVLGQVNKLLEKRGEKVLSAQAALTDVKPTDVYDLATLVMGEVAHLHALSPNVGPVQPFEPAGDGHRLPSHCFQLIRTLEAQLASL